MKQFLIVFLFLVSLVSARAAELSCLCFEDTVSDVVSKTEVVKSSDHHSEDHSQDSGEHTDHCQHTCSQCHFAALIPLNILYIAPSSSIHLEPTLITSLPEKLSFAFYRPPIS